MSKRNLDIGRRASYFLPMMMKVMLLVADLFVWMIAYGAMLMVMAFILSKTAARMLSKVPRFVVFFVLGVPYGMAYGYSKVLVLGHTKMSWIELLILALPGAFLGAILFTCWGPRTQDSNIQ